MKKADKEKAEAITQLREWIKPGDTVYTILDHVSRSGMSRAIRVVLLETDENGRPTDLHPNYSVGKALGLRHWRSNGRQQDALVVGGCGMDMGFHLVYELSHVLYGDGYTCLGERCPSPEHTNNRRRRVCDCGHEEYHHTITESEGWHRVYGACEQIGCNCQAFQLLPPVDHRGAGVIHRDGYALRHRWL